MDQKIDAIEFLQRIKAIALFFNGLSDTETKAIKNWIKNTTPKKLADSAIEILEAKREDIDKMVASNTFILDEMEEKAEAKGIEKGIRKVILKQYSKGLAIEYIADINDLTIEYVESVVKDLKKNI